MTKLPHKRGYPGDGYYYVICDVCGKKLRAKDTVLIKDKYNLQYNLLVCKDDADETNPQQYIKAITERQIDSPSIIRSEGEDRFVFISDVSEIEGGDTSDPTGRNASAPKHLTVIGASSSFVELQWLGPDDPGSSSIINYQIERESPVGGGFSVLTTTVAAAGYYKDTTVTGSTQYNYRVSAINRNGTGDASNEANITTNA